MTGASSRVFAGAVRCSLAAQARGDSLIGTALPVDRFILIETPGAWVTGFWDSAALPPAVAMHLRAAAIAHHARLLLIRRPGRHPAGGSPVRRWAVVTRDGVRWGSWTSADGLLNLDAGQVISALAASPSAPDRPVALVCTHGRKDVCCAIEGRPVAAALARDDRIDVWECSHVGGDRFAANLLWLPSGLMFGGLTPATATAVGDHARSGRVVLEHFRGRCGDPAVAQAAKHHLMLRLGEDRPFSVTIEAMAITSPADPVSVTAVHEGLAYELVLEPFWTPAHHLTCQAQRDARMRSHRLLSLTPR